MEREMDWFRARPSPAMENRRGRFVHEPSAWLLSLPPGRPRTGHPQDIQAMSTALEHVCNMLDLSDKAKRERELFAQKIVALASAKPRSYGTACCERLLMAKAYGRRRSFVSLEAGRRATHRAASLAASPRSTPAAHVHWLCPVARRPARL